MAPTIRSGIQQLPNKYLLIIMLPKTMDLLPIQFTVLITIRHYQCFVEELWSNYISFQNSLFIMYKIGVFFKNLFIFLYSRFLLVIHFIHISVHVSIPISQFITHTHTHTHPDAFPPWCPYICSLCLCLNFCPANQFICTIFLGSTYMR